jgi:hypothetical protein
VTSNQCLGYDLANMKCVSDELSSEWGNPFSADRNVLTPGAGCEVFNCGPNNAACYSTPAHKKVYGCPQPVDLTLTLCKK